MLDMMIGQPLNPFLVNLKNSIYWWVAQEMDWMASNYIKKSKTKGDYYLFLNLKFINRYLEHTPLAIGEVLKVITNLVMKHSYSH